MADAPAGGAASSAPAKASGGSPFGFLGRKLGPLPVWAYALIAVGGYYWYTHYGPGASSSSAQQSAGTSPIIIVGGGGGADQDTDTDTGGGQPKPKPKPGPKPGPGGSWKSITVPAAWNGWSLDRIAKYLHWDPQTLKDVEEANARGGKELTGKTTFHTGDTFIRPIGAAKDNVTGAGAQDAAAQAKATPSAASGAALGATTKPQAAEPGGVLATYAPYNGQNQWKTATGWTAAAINYLIGEGVPPDQASTSVYAYQHSEPLSSRMQANVTLAQDGIGPPPNQPAPTPVVKRITPRNTPRARATKVAA
jgi:hypothetical protein